MTRILSHIAEAIVFKGVTRAAILVVVIHPQLIVHHFHFHAIVLFHTFSSCVSGLLSLWWIIVMCNYQSIPRRNVAINYHNTRSTNFWHNESVWLLLLSMMDRMAEESLCDSPLWPLSCKLTTNNVATTNRFVLQFESIDRNHRPTRLFILRSEIWLSCWDLITLTLGKLSP